MSVLTFLLDWWLIRKRENAEKKQTAMTMGEVVNSIISLDKCKLGIQIRNMKMVFNIYGNWRWVMFEKLMMKIYDFFFIRLSHLVTPYNIV